MKAERTVKVCPDGTRTVTFDWAGEAWTQYVIFPREYILELLRKRRRYYKSQPKDFACNRYSLAELGEYLKHELLGIGPGSYGGPGRAFHGGCGRMKSSRRFVVVAASGGLDI